MPSLTLLSVFIVHFSTIYPGLKANYCNDVKYITIDDARRSTMYNSSWKRICDRSIIQDNAWYRFSSEAGEAIPTKLPKRGTCGTFVPIWMNGSHPTIEEGTVERKACAYIPYRLPLGCGQFYKIRVRNCTGFYIYQLKTPSHCYFAYCAGSKLPNCTNADPDDYCLGNRPPYISMADRLYAFENSEFQLVFNATDPEGYPMIYRYIPSKTSCKVSVNQIQKLVTISVRTSATVVLEVRDYGGRRSNHTIKIIALPCGCQNGGKCYNTNKKNVSTKREELKNYECDCLQAYTGKFCEISPCDALPCFPGLKCSVIADSYLCEKCPMQFKGDGKDCQLIHTADTSVVEAEFTIVSGLKWREELLNKTSPFYKQQTAEIVAQVIQAYSGTEHFSFAVVTGYRNGSVVVEFQVIFKEKVKDPLKPLRTRVQHNQDLGRYKVDRFSVKERDTVDVKGELSVVSELEWKDDLLDKSSSYYAQVSLKVETEINKVYAGEVDFLGVYVTGFREENLVVEFKLVWRKKVNNPLEKLRTEAKNGMLGTLKIDAESVKEKTRTTSPKAKSYFGLDKAVFIALVCLVLIVALISIVVCGICIKKKRINIIMLTVNEDRREMCPNSNEESSFPMKKKPSRNQVVDIDSVWTR